MDLKLCACPGRDMKHDEEETKINDHQPSSINFISAFTFDVLECIFFTRNNFKECDFLPSVSYVKANGKKS
jgi:hypothetical protein